MKNFRKFVRECYIKEVMVSWLVFYMVLGIPAQVVMANPNPGATALPTGIIDQLGINNPVTVNNDMSITQTANQAIVNWQTFDIGSDASVTFTQPGAGSAVLNRVHDGAMSGIMGDLNANGRVFIINPAGMVFGSGANINVNQLVASSLDITDADFRNGMPYTFTGGADAGNVDFRGTTTDRVEAIAFIGKHVINTGTVLAENTVVMAAGDTVRISETGGTVGVDVTIPAGADPCGFSGFTVNHNGGGIEAQHVVLAAGDIWSSAYIDAEGNGSASVKMDAKRDVDIRDWVDVEAYPGSPAVATVEITAGGDVDIEDEVCVEAYGDGDNNATATITVNAGGDVTVDGYDDDAGLYAEAYGGATNTAEITISAVEDVEVTAEYGYADVYAGTYGGTTNNSSVDVTAGGDVRVDAYDDSFAGIEAEAYAQPYPEQTVTNTVSTTINAGGKVVARADDDSEVDIDSEAWNGTKNTATTTITAGEYVKAKATDDGDAAIEAEAHGGTASNTATVDITVTGVEDSENYRNGGVYVIAEYDSQAEIEALADMDIEYGEFSQAAASERPYIEPMAVNTAKTVINAAEEVEVTADGSYSEAYLDAVANNGLTNSGTVTVTAGCDVIVRADGYDSEAFLGSDVWEGETNTAAVTVDAGGNVLVIAMGDDEGDTEAEIGAYAEEACLSNEASVDITANNVVAFAGNDGDARIKARAAHTYGQEEPKIETLIAQQSDGEEPAADGTSNTASVTIHAFKVAIEEPVEEPSVPDGPSFASALPSGGLDEILADYIDGGHVAAVAYNGGDAQIEAVTYGGYGSDPINTSDVLICAEGIVAAGALDCGERYTNAEISALSHFGFENNSSVGIGAQQGVGVLAMGWGASASISSDAMYGYTNTADLVACTGGPVGVLAMNGGEAAIESGAFYGQTDSAYTGVRADSLVIVGAANNGDAIITSEAGSEQGSDIVRSTSLNGYYEPPTATAETIVVSMDSGVAVVALEEGYADISSSANAYFSDAYTGVDAQDHVIVAAGTDEYLEGNFGDFFGGGDSKSLKSIGGSGGEAYIRSEAGSSYRIASSVEKVDVQQVPNGEYVPSTANAETAVISHEGSVLVADATGYGVGSAAIESGAYNAYSNTAYTGVAAGASLTPATANAEDELPEEEPDNIIDYVETLYHFKLAEEIGTGNVIVSAEGPGSDARIISETAYGFENTADTVVCAPGEVSVESDDYFNNDPCYFTVDSVYLGGPSIATIKSWAHGGEIDTATTQVYASEVYVEVDTLRYGNGIGAYGDGGWINIDNNTANDGYGNGYPSDGGWDWVASEDDSILFEGESEGSTLIIDSYASKRDCPDCPPIPDCPDCGEELLAPVAPLPQFEVPRIEGCPALMQATAMELGIPAETLQIAIGNSVAMNPTIQPCQACSTLIGSANLLKNEGGMRMAAMVQAFNTLAPADAPFTPELSASVATAFATAEEGSIYASAAEYIDALVQYVNTLDTDLGSPVGDSVAYVMEKYGTQITGSSNANLTAFVTARIETSATFAE